MRRRGVLDWLFGGGGNPTSPPRQKKPGTWVFPDEKARDEDGYFPIVCPYCLDTFHIWEAEFRSVAPAGVATNTVNIQSQPAQQNDNWGRSKKDSSNEQNRSPFKGLENLDNSGENSQISNSGASSFSLEMDDKYDSFEKKVSGEEPAFRGKVLKIFGENGEPTGEVTHITLMDRQKGGNDKNYVRVPIEGRHARDFDKAPIMSVINKYGQLCNERICPHCHHRVSDYVGIWPSYTVALIGDTKVGKTVYLHKLGAALTSRGILGGSLLGSEANPAYKSWIKTAMEMDKRAQDNQATMTGLTTIQFMPPNIINFLKRQVRDGFILNLFDFPGEALSKPINEDDGSMDEFKAHYLPKIDRMDAFMLLFDAGSFQTVRTVFESDDELKKYIADRSNAVTAIEIINYFEREYLAAHGNQFTKPLAIIVSKSDLIKLARDKDSDFFPDLPADQRFLDPNPNANRDKKKVDLDDLYQCNVEIEAFLHEDYDDQALYERGTLDQVNGESCWFALSSKGDATNVAANPIRVTEPMEWILWRLGLVKGEGTQIPGGGDPIRVE